MSTQTRRGRTGFSRLNDELVRVRGRGLDYIDSSRRGSLPLQDLEELEALASLYATGHAPMTRQARITRLITDAAPKILVARHRRRVILLFGIAGREAASPTNLRNAATAELSEYGLSASQRVLRDRRAFVALERALRQLVERSRDFERQDAAPTRTNPTPVLLPHVDAVFVNRLGVLNRLAQLTSASRSLSFVVGMGGAGKSRAALEFADRYRDRFEHFVLYVDLSSRRRIDVMFAIAEAAGVSDGFASLETEAHRVDFLRTALAGKRALVILDDAEPRARIGSLLEALSPVHTVVTTRSRALGGLRRRELIPVSPLDRLHSMELLRLIVGPDRIDADPDAALSICRRVGDLPLALRVLGARAAKSPLPMRAFVDMLEAEGLLDGLDLDASKASRSDSVQACLRVSFQSLDDAERLAMGGIAHLGLREVTLDCVAALLKRAPPTALRVLESLYGLSLVEPGQSHRWGLHPLVAEFGRSVFQFDQDQIDRALGYAEQLAIAARAHFRGADEAAWFERLSENEALLERASEDVSASRRANVLAALSRQRSASGRPVESLSALVHLGQVVEGPARVAALEAATWLAGDLGQFKVGVETGRLWLDDALEAEDRASTAAALGRLASHAWCIGHYDEASSFLAEAMSNWVAMADKAGVATGWNLRGLLEIYQGRASDAIEWFGLASDAFGTQRDVIRQSMAIHNLGEALRCCGDLSGARKSFLEALSIRQAFGRTWDIINTRNCLAELERACGNLVMADAAYLEAFELAVPMWNPVAVATSVIGRATIHMDRDGDWSAIAVGAGESLLSGASATLGPANQADYPYYRKALEARMGSRFTSLLQRGAQLTRDDVIEHMMEKSELTRVFHADRFTAPGGV